MTRTIALLLALATTSTLVARPPYSPTEIQAFRSAANLGNADAQFNLGVIYRTGNSVPKDAAEAGKWYSKAAKQGHAVAQLNLGVLYAYGEGVEKDPIQAYIWLSIADSNGSKDAKKVLGTVEKDMTDAQKTEAAEATLKLSEKLPK